MKILPKPIFILLFLLSTVALAQSNQPFLKFKKLKDLPHVQEWPASACDGKYIYSINGYAQFDEGVRPDIFKFDPQKGQWTLLTKKAGYKMQASAVYFPADDHIYVFGGLDAGAHMIFQGVQRIDVKTGEVEGLNVHNPMAGYLSCAVGWDNKIYLFGGTEYNKHTTSALYCFDPATTEFKRLADMPESLETAGAVVNGVIYTFGGYDQFLQRQSKSVNAYDINTNSWKTVANLPQSTSATSVAVEGDLIFVAGSYDEETFLGVYNTRTNKFTQLKSNMEPRRAAGSAIINNTLYLYGGKTKPRQITGGIKTVQAADLSSLLTIVK